MISRIDGVRAHAAVSATTATTMEWQNDANANHNRHIARRITFTEMFARVRVHVTSMCVVRVSFEMRNDE